MSGDVYVFVYDGRESEVFLARASSEAEAFGLICEDQPAKPLAECIGTIDDVVDEDPGMVRLA